MPPPSQVSSSSRVFHFKRCLGTGSFGEVYEATMTSPGGLEKRVAVKLLKAEMAGDEDAVRRLRDEGLLLSSLDHPSILAVIDLVKLGDRRALVTEFVDGQDLLELLRTEDRIPLRPLVQAVAQVARALDAAWSTKLPGSDAPLHLLHRDIKPANIRIGKHGLVKLLDFGIARSDEVEREARTETDVLMGSIPYMAPEIFSRSSSTDRVDVFALGCVLYEGVFGEKLYLKLKRPRVIQLLVSQEDFEAYIADRLQQGERGSDLPPVVARTVADCLAWEPEERPSSADLASRLERLASGLDGPSLAEWCRARDWGEPRAHDGNLVGSTITEGSIHLGTMALERPPAPRGTPWLPIAAVVALTVGCMGLVGAATFGLTGPGAASVEVVPDPVPTEVEPSTEPSTPGPSTPEPADGPEPSEVPEPSDPEPTDPEPSPEPPAPASEPEVRPQPVAAPSPVPKPQPAPTAPSPSPSPVPASVPSPTPVPSPSPVASPSPAPAPAGAPAPAPSGGPVSVWFQNGAGERFGPDKELPPGPYAIIADFGDGAREVGQADVKPGQEIRLVCSPRDRTCSLK
ncbi:MAG: protein kinase [Alphaproteobacteria bacterium]|nr:protein kinase [Alphaproteobacteria bacterium]